MKPLSLRQFGHIVARVLEALPEHLRPYLENVVVDVEEGPSAEDLRRAGFTDEEIAAGETVYGLFVPLPLPGGWAGDELDLASRPNRVILYKRPLEEDFPDRRRLMIEIRKTVLHELSHHFGFTDRDLEPFDDDPDPFGGKGDEA